MTETQTFMVGDIVQLSPLAAVELHDTGAWVQDESRAGRVIESPTSHGYVRVQWAYGTASYRPAHLEYAPGNVAAGLITEAAGGAIAALFEPLT